MASGGLEMLIKLLQTQGVNFDPGFGKQSNNNESEDSDKDASSAASSQGGGAASNKGTAQPSLSFADFAPKLTRKVIIALVIAILLVAAAAYWWFHPPISIHSFDTWTYGTVFILLPAFIILRARAYCYENGTKTTNKNDSKATLFKRISYVPVAVVALGVLGALASFAFFPGNAAKYASILDIETLDYTQDIQEVNYSEVPVIDRASAVLLGNREMGSIPEYVSQFEISSLYSQINYQGAPVRVSPLGYADLFKWLTNREAGIPAYALVNMTTQDAEIVTLDEGIHYSQSEPLARNIDRYVQLSYPFYIFDELSFEIDEDGHPWWICPVQNRTIGLFGGTTISRVVMVDAVSGECTDLAVEDVPQWVDRAYPAELLVQQYNWFGAYQDGWLNSWLGQKNVVQTTPGSDGSLGYNYIAKDDDVWVYTGVTSATSDNSIVGFVLVNQRTAEAHFYSVAGATEESAQASAEGQVQNLRYTATFPILLNVAGQPTYFMALKDNAGLVKQFAMIDIQRYQNVAVGDTVAKCQENYETLLLTNGVLSASDVSSELLDTKGTIASMTQVVIEGNSHFYVGLESDSSLYDFALPSLVNILNYKVGDSISFSYIEGDGLNTVYTLGDNVLDLNVSSGEEESSSSQDASAEESDYTDDGQTAEEQA